MYKVLLADDEPLILEGLAAAISWDEYDLELAGTALNGAEAWEFVKNGNIDVLITDIKMPKINGVELISRIRQAGLPIKCIVLSGYSDFEYVKECARLGIENYLIKPVNLEECHTTLEEVVSKLDLECRKHAIWVEGQAVLRENTLQRWMFNSIDEKELIEHGELLGLKLSGGFRAAVIHWPGKGLAEDASITGQISGLCRQRVEDYGTGYMVAQPYCRILILFHAKNAVSSQREATTVLSRIANEIYTQYGFRAIATVGDYAQSFRDAGISMRHALEMIDYRLLNPEKTVFSFEEYLQNQSEFPRFVNELLDQLQDLLTMKLNRKDVLAHLDMLSYRITPESVLKNTHLYSLCILTIMQIIQAVSLHQPNTLERLEKVRQNTADIYRIGEFEDIMNWMRLQINEILDIAEEDRGSYSKPIARILSYIDSYYNQDINLKTIAGELGMSPLYLGQLFSSEVGNHFTEYLNKYRIKQARRLMKQDISLKEIAQKVGYTNWNYFYTVFKKYVGVPPSELKKELSE